jgi:hypothetical protein
MKNIFIVFFLSSIAFLTISCDNPEDPNKGTDHNRPVGNPEYAPGQVVASFNDTTDYGFIRSFFTNIHLSPISINADSTVSVWIQVDSGNVNDYLTRLQHDSTVSWADHRGYPLSDGDASKAYILVQFKNTIKINYAQSLIQSINGISWKKLLISPRSALLEVPIGQENKWIDSLKTYTFIRYAELNYIAHLEKQ